MPIRNFRPKRKSRIPLAFFKGSIKEVQKIPSEKVISALKERGLRFFNETETKAIIKKLRQEAGKLAMKQDGKRKIQKLVDIDTPSGGIVVKLTVSPKGQVCLYQHPQTHGITRRGVLKRGSIEVELSTFETLQRIVKEGFKGQSGSNVLVYDNRREMPREAFATTDSTLNLGHYIDGTPRSKKLLRKTIKSLKRESRSTWGDRYAVVMMTPTKKGRGSFIEYAKPEEILSINIKLTEGLTTANAKKRMKFYKKKLKGMAIHFV